MGIWIHRDRREIADGFLDQALQHEHAGVRFDAARSLAYARDPRSRTALEQALGDPDPLVRHEALFALGQLRGVVPAEVFLGRLAGEEPGMRLLAVYGLARHGTAAELDAVAALLRDREPRVRGQAALAVLALAGNRLRDPKAGDDASVRRASEVLRTALAAEQNDAARWREVYALAHLADPGAVDVLRAEAKRSVAERDQEWGVLFALRGLSGLPPERETELVLIEALGRPEQSLVIEAVAALANPGRQPGARRDSLEPTYRTYTTRDALLAVASDARPLVRAAALRELGRYAGIPVENALLAAVAKGTAHNRAAALFGLAIRPVEETRSLIEAAAADDDPVLRIGAARAWGRLEFWHGAIPYLQRLAADPERWVGVAAAEALGQFRGSPAAAQAIRELLAIDDLALREALAPAAQAVGDKSVVPALLTAYDASPGLPFAEARKLLLEAAAALDLDTAKPALERALTDPDLVVRRAARRLLGRPEEPDDRQAGIETPVPGETFPWGFVSSRPRIVFTTDKGEFEIQLSPATAPTHCLNLLMLVEQGHYDGRRFHRVVPNFVVQGGDHRGDGSGARAWHGGQIRDEIGPLPFDAFTVGMPKSADDDTGGDQIFITTVPTPHLDGRYTAFGRVVRGSRVVESIELGDRILRAVVKRD